MTRNRFINTGGGNYNEFIHGDSVNIQGNTINVGQDFNVGQDLTQLNTEIQRLLAQFQSQGDTQESAQRKLANQLATQAETTIEDPILI